MIKVLALLLFFVAHTANAFSTKTIEAEVRDLSTGEPIAGATISDGSLHLVSDRLGRFSIILLADKELVITAIGYKQVAIKIPYNQSFITITMEPVAGNLGDVVVSGTLRAMTKLASPIPVESYSARYFQRNPTPSLFDAVSLLNGVQSQVTCNVCNTGEIRINGLDGPYTMVLIDGMPIVSSLSTVYGLSGIPNSMVKRIEVVKGPASTLYGSEAVGGIINIITQDPLTAHSLHADINMTTLQELNIDVGTRIKAGKAIGMLGFNLFNYTQPHDVNNDNFTDITQQKRMSMFNKWSLDRPNNLPASMAIRLLAESRYGGELNWTDAYKGSDSIYGESIDTRRVEMIGQYGISNPLMLEYSYNYHHQDSYYGDTYYMGKQHTGFAQLRWNRQVGNHYLLAGIPLRYQWYDDNTTATQHADGQNNPSVQKMAGLFVQDEYTWSKKMSMLSGLRYEYTNLQGGVFAPRLALKWQPTTSQTVRLTGGNGFRIVNLFTEDHAALSGFREVVIEEDLKPERSWNANLNYAAQIKPAWGLLNLDISGFYTWFNNRIIPDYDADPQKIFYRNLEGSAISRGFSANFDLVTTHGLKIMTGVTYMDVFVQEPDDDGKLIKTPQVYAPKWSGNYGLTYLAKKWNTSFDITGRLTGPMRLPVFPNDFRPEYSPWYTLVNLQVTKKLSHDFEVYGAVKNLLNFLPKNPILHPDDPFDKAGGPYWLANGTPNPTTNPHGYSFDPGYNYAPMQGIKLMLGFRVSLH